MQGLCKLNKLVDSKGLVNVQQMLPVPFTLLL